MTYDKQLPPVHKLLELAQKTWFPISGADIVQVATDSGSPQLVVDFLKLFPADEVFMSRVDFMTRSEELELLIGQERAAPIEILRSPQD